MNEKEVTENHFGIHYMLDGYGADKASLENKDGLSDLLHTLPEEMGMYSICEPVVVEVGPNCRKDPGGISGFVMIAESHISFHTFPGREFVTVDVYTCMNNLDTDRLTKKFVDFFKINEVEENIIKRATKYPVKNLH